MLIEFTEQDLGELLFVTRAVANLTRADEIEEAKKANETWIRNQRIAKGSPPLATAAGLIARAKNEMKQERLRKQTMQEAKTNIEEGRSTLGDLEGYQIGAGEDANGDRRAAIAAAKASVKTNEMILREQIESEGAAQAQKFASQLNSNAVRARSDAGQTLEEKSIRDGVLSWVKKQKSSALKRGW